MTELYTVEEVARQLKVHRQTVYKWLYAGRLKGVKVGRVWRIPQDALEAFLRSPLWRDNLRDIRWW